MVGHLAALDKEYEIVVSANCDVASLAGALPGSTRFRPNRVGPGFSPLTDIREILRLARWMRVERFDVVHTVSPTAGLIGMVAARAAGVPIRIHMFTGQAWATETGVTRRRLRRFDRLLARCTTVALADSQSQLDFLVTERVLRPGQGSVPGRGSIAGVDRARFHPDAGARTEIRTELGLSDDDLIVLFVGRLTRDKGIIDLVEAFARSASRLPRLHLVVVGPDDAGYAGRLRTLAGTHVGALHLVGQSDRPERYLAAADVFCLPSYREGFGVSVIEAAACGLPAIVSRIYGLTDAVVADRTGLFHGPGDTVELAARISELAGDAPLRRRLGAAAEQWVHDHFSSEDVTAALVEVYHRALATSTPARRPRAVSRRFRRP